MQDVLYQILLVGQLGVLLDLDFHDVPDSFKASEYCFDVLWGFEGSRTVNLDDVSLAILLWVHGEDFVKTVKGVVCVARAHLFSLGGILI